MKHVIAIFPGSFDPITNGHIDVIRRASRLVDKLIVAVGVNPEKSAAFTPAERVEMITELVGDLENVEVDAYEGLTVDFARGVGATLIIRGIRDAMDLRSEMQAANANALVGNVETMFLMANEQLALTSSTFIKQIISMGGESSKRLSALVPESVLTRMRERFADGK